MQDPAESSRGGHPREPDTLLAAMHLEEKVSLLAGQDAWRLAGVERLGIPALVTSDGPTGVRGPSFIAGRSVSFPCGTSLAASWDPALIEEVGRAIGIEARRAGVHMLLAPTVNLHRHPLAGRNFECFSEDPLLSAEAAAAYVRGVQQAGVACCVKHFACNDSEFERYTIDSVVDEAVQRELYFTPFAAAIRAGAWSVMAAYNKVNGSYATENAALLTEVLRDDWGFDGVVVSDWYATQSGAAALLAGLDVEMPGPGLHRGDALQQLVAAGRVPMAAVDRSVRRILTLIERVTTHAELGDTSMADAVAVSRRTAARGMVLLRNDGALPLDPAKLTTVAVIGPGAEVGTFQGGGSGQVNPEQVAGILPALRAALRPADVLFARGCVLSDWPQPVSEPIASTAGKPGVRVSYWNRDDGEPIADPEIGRQLTLTWIGPVLPGHADGTVRIAVETDLHLGETGIAQIVFSGSGRVRIRLDDEEIADETWHVSGGEVFELPSHTRRVSAAFHAGTRRRLTVLFDPGTHGGVNRLEVTLVQPDPADLADQALALARRSDLVILVAHSPSGWEAEGRDRTTMDLPGAQNELISTVAAANPRTVVVVNAGVPITMPWLPEVAAVVQTWFPGQTIGDALADVLTGAVNPSGRLPMTYVASPADLPADAFYPGADGRVVYGECFELGYRRLSEAAPAAVFPFGFGLSYSAFALDAPTATVIGADDGPRIEISVPVRHQSGPAGRAVVQVYARSGWADRPMRELVGFGSVELGPGECAAARIVIPADRLRWWRDGRWQAPEQAITLLVGTSSADLPFAMTLPTPLVPSVGGEIVGVDVAYRV